MHPLSNMFNRKDLVNKYTQLQARLNIHHRGCNLAFEYVMQEAWVQTDRERRSSMKPLGRKAYGSIPHLSGSRLGPSDKKASEGHEQILLGEHAKTRHFNIIIQEKLDGSCVAVYKPESHKVIALSRAGYEANTSPYEMHHHWNTWVQYNAQRFLSILNVGEWCVGEWCLQAHGTRYILPSEPFFLFDIFIEGERVTYGEIQSRMLYRLTPAEYFRVPHTLAIRSGVSFPLSDALDALGRHGHHGAIDRAEGVVYRAERDNKTEFLAKYVYPDKEDGKFLFGDPVYNAWPTGLNSCVSIEHLNNRDLEEQWEELLPISSS